MELSREQKNRRIKELLDSLRKSGAPVPEEDEEEMPKKKLGVDRLKKPW